MPIVRTCGYVDIDVSKTLIGSSLRSIVNLINAKKEDQSLRDIERIADILSSVQFTSRFNYKFEKKLQDDLYTGEIVYRFAKSVKELMVDIRDSLNHRFNFIDYKSCFMSCPLCYTNTYRIFRRGRGLQLAQLDDEESPCMVWEK